MIDRHLWPLLVRFGELRAGNRGATAVEYGLIAASIVGVIVAVVTSIGIETGYGFGDVNDNYGSVKPAEVN